ncbi:capping complex subunit for YIEGIA [Ferroacidibacillus organovorans]|uniref:Uncharacterized protein n=1 Tax=Ferroacidibacillus organovorans TaxID=1765683 RepID=A0A853KC19_9BACL|nr:hypothetical protein [Ferroacidibacillus organovorans]KYP79940.1 hypothetical protein AYJ22_03325 [Ferroacidibacillus organovorans]OAG94582.1 hypothetical protein AYW79_04290 [Ferroacidibacillus organovorans]
MSNPNQIYALIGTLSHSIEQINPGNAIFIRAKDEQEQEVLMREIALAVVGDVVKLSNGLYLILAAIR